MDDPRLQPLEPELAALLEAERASSAPTQSLGRVWLRVERTLGPAGPGDGGSGGAGGGGNGDASGWLASHAGIVAAAAFVAGGIVGAGLHAMLHKPPLERVVYVERPVPAAAAPTRSPSDTPSAPLSSVAELSPQPQPPRVSPSRATPGPSASSSLSAERAVLDQARTALARYDGARALALTDEHARRFTRPQLGEEREAIAIQALVVGGRYDEAKARGARFRAASPTSLFLPAVDASLASIP